MNQNANRMKYWQIKVANFTIGHGQKSWLEKKCYRDVFNA